MDCETLVRKFKKVSISKATLEEIKRFSKKMVAAKGKESHYKIDDDVMYERHITGFSGEAAVEKFLGEPFIDLTIGHSYKYNIGDLTKLGIDCGIKTVEWGKFHVVHQKAERPEILVIKENDKDFLICGVATREILEKYQDLGLIMNAKLKSRNVKAGFYGYKHLLKFSNLEELKDIIYG